MKITKQNLQNPIRVNHRGFISSASKRFILTENITESLEFSVIFTDNVQEIVVFKGTMTKHTENNNTLYQGDFSAVLTHGDYYIEAGGFRSRQFVIYDGAYDICQRTMLQYFTYQRCGHALGWAGECHLDDGFISETGERVDLSGGYHQSCDLRKSPGGVSIGVLGMLKFALKDASKWGEILVCDEVKWALDYYIKAIQENGAMYNTLNAPFGWDGRIFYNSPAPSSAQWNVTNILALGFLYFKDKNPKYASNCLEIATKSYNYLTSDARPTSVYKHPDKYPMGMDPDFFYDQCFKGSTADIAYQISVASSLYRATKNEAYLNDIINLLPSLLSYIDGFNLRRNDNNLKIVTSSCSYSWLMGGLLSLCDAYEILGNHFNLENTIENILNDICEYMDKSVWKKAEKLYCDADLDVVDGHLNQTRRESMGVLHKYKDYYYSNYDIFEPVVACYFGVFLARGAKILKSERYMSYAQAIADLLLGANELDSCHIYGIGYNHAQHKSYGQFFPSTPFIPGAVGVGYHSIDVESGSTSEYDMPCVGIAMYLLSEITNK